MAVERGADTAPSPDGLENRLDHRLVGEPPLLSLDVAAVQGARVRVQALEPRAASGLGREVEEVVGLHERGARLGCQLLRADPRADDGERTAGLGHMTTRTTRPFWVFPDSASIAAAILLRSCEVTVCICASLSPNFSPSLRSLPSL